MSAHANRQKSDRDPAEWMPPYEPARCRYIAEWIATKLRWGLSADAKEAAALTEYTHQCPNAPLKVHTR
ncbi:hypothetical protein ACQB60_44755 [Actinomycetota bacterium Odt1-20B]